MPTVRPRLRKCHPMVPLIGVSPVGYHPHQARLNGTTDRGVARWLPPSSGPSPLVVQPMLSVAASSLVYLYWMR